MQAIDCNIFIFRIDCLQLVWNARTNINTLFCCMTIVHTWCVFQCGVEVVNMVFVHFRSMFLKNKESYALLHTFLSWVCVLHAKRQYTYHIHSDRFHLFGFQCSYKCRPDTLPHLFLAHSVLQRGVGFWFRSRRRCMWAYLSRWCMCKHCKPNSSQLDVSVYHSHHHSTLTSYGKGTGKGRRG